ncbi:hypothetical protein F4678DRAFT_462122 [Xylaria arbuscula]|nr:hypothetical protein F4678DRAFT_462122 [Xylaria arbuscula]
MAPKISPCFEDLPVELVECVLRHLDDYKYLINAMCASRLVHGIFQATSLRLLARIARNTIEPEALQMALAAFYCNTDRLPYPPNECHSTSYYVKNGYPLYQFPFELSFPTQQPEITKFFYFCKMVNSVGDILISNYQDQNSKMLRQRSDFAPFDDIATGAEDPQRCHLGKDLPDYPLATLTTEERGRFQRKLYQYEFVVKAMRQDRSSSHDMARIQSISPTWRARLLHGLGVVERFQLFTIEDWVIHSYHGWELGLHKSFADEIAQASRKLEESRGLCNADTDSITNIPLINTEEVFTEEEVGNTIPYLCRYGQNHRREFISMLQSFGLKLYKEMSKATTAKRNELILSAHKMFDMRRRNRCRFDFSHHDTLRRMNPISQQSQLEWTDRVEKEQVKFPNTYLQNYAKMIQPYPQLMIGSYGAYLVRTGWWFWDDQHLSRLNFKYHHALDEVMTPASKIKLLQNFIYVDGYVANIHGLGIEVDRRKEGRVLLQSDWQDILSKYKMEGTGYQDVL